MFYVILKIANLLLNISKFLNILYNISQINDFKIAPLILDALSPSPLSPLCIFKAFTHATRIPKSHDVLNDIPDTYFVVWTK